MTAASPDTPPDSIQGSGALNAASPAATGRDQRSSVQ
jgi:hypothetical protein